MSQVLDLRVPGSPAALRSAATQLDRVVTTLTTAHADLGPAQNGSADFWSGGAGEDFRDATRDIRTDLETAKSSLEGAAAALETFAGELEAAKAKMQSARAVALEAGLSVGESTVTEPPRPADGADDATVEAYNTKIEAWNTAVGHHDDGRTKEEEAHTGLASGMRTALDVSWIERVLISVGVLPETGADGVQMTGWGLGLAGTAGGVVAGWQINSRYGRFAPRGANGRWVSPSSLSRWQWGVRSMSGSNWVPKANQAATHARWSTASKWLGRAGGAVTFATSAYGQWTADADDPSLTDAERVGRTAWRGGTAAAGAWGGATAGAAIGTAIFPGAGTVVGGLVGGAIGGFVGSEFGGATVDWVGDRVDDVWEGAKDVGGAIGDGVKKLKFW